MLIDLDLGDRAVARGQRDVGVDRCEVALDGHQPTLNGQTTEIQFSQLRASTYLVTVRAYDAANNPSPELIITINTPDGGPPTWGNAQLVGTAGITEVEPVGMQPSMMWPRLSTSRWTAYLRRRSATIPVESPQQRPPYIPGRKAMPQAIGRLMAPRQP